MKKREIPLNFTETADESISEICQCEFCDRPIRFYLHKRWIDGVNSDYHVQNENGEPHRHCYKPTGWSRLGAKAIPDGWEYRDSDNDDDGACFTQKKYTKFEKQK